jgi:hypothetical protein
MERDHQPDASQRKREDAAEEQDVWVRPRCVGDFFWRRRGAAFQPRRILQNMIELFLEDIVDAHVNFFSCAVEKKNEADLRPFCPPWI